MATKLSPRRIHNQLADSRRCGYLVKDEITGKREKCGAIAYVTINASHVPAHRCIGHVGTVATARERSAKRNETLFTLLKQFGLE